MSAEMVVFPVGSCHHNGQLGLGHILQEAPHRAAWPPCQVYHCAHVPCGSTKIKICRPTERWQIESNAKFSYLPVPFLLSFLRNQPGSSLFRWGPCRPLHVPVRRENRKDLSWIIPQGGFMERFLVIPSVKLRNPFPPSGNGVLYGEKGSPRIQVVQGLWQNFTLPQPLVLRQDFGGLYIALLLRKDTAAVFLHIKPSSRRAPVRPGNRGGNPGRERSRRIPQPPVPPPPASAHAFGRG